MHSLKKALGYGFLLWLIPFLVSVGLVPVKRDIPALFESLMPVVLAVCTMFFLRLYYRGAATTGWGEASLLGGIWMAMSLLFDLPMFGWGPMKMTLPNCLADIGAALPDLSGVDRGSLLPAPGADFLKPGA